MNGPGTRCPGQSVSTAGCTRMSAYFGGCLSLSSGPDHQTGPFLSCCLRPQENDSAKSSSQAVPAVPWRTQCAHPATQPQLPWPRWSISPSHASSLQILGFSRPKLREAEAVEKKKKKDIYPLSTPRHLSWENAKKNSMMSSPD